MLIFHFLRLSFENRFCKSFCEQLWLFCDYFYMARTPLAYKPLLVFQFWSTKSASFYFTFAYIVTHLFVSETRPRPYLFKGDHKFPTLKEDGPVVILYAEIGTKDFVKFHKILSEKAQKEEIVYILRHYVQVCSSS